MSIAENRARYADSALEALMQQSGHHICERCYCCDSVPESATCWSCMGMCDDPDDEWSDGWCDVCEGEGEVYFFVCLGKCDDNGEHATRERQG